MSDFADVVIQTDFTELDTYDGSQRPLLPKGDYTLKVVHVEQKTLNGKPAIVVESEVVEPVEHAGAKVWNNYFLKSKDDTGLKRLKALMVACGASLDAFRAAEIMDVSYRAEIIHTEGKGKLDADGNELPSKTFANVIRERPLEDGATQAAVEPPPITKGGKGANGANKPAARRA